MTTEQLLESEKDQLQDYLYGYCDNPLATADDKLKNLFWFFDVGEDELFKISSALEYAEKDSYFSSTVPPNLPYSVWFNVSEIETEKENIEPEEIDEYTITGDMAYYYVGYGLMIEYDPMKIYELLLQYDKQ